MQSTDAVEAGAPQSVVNAYFRKEAAYWAEIYERNGIKEAIHKERLRAALAMAVGLRLAPAARVLDVGCGAGLAAIGLARQGLMVEAIDPIQVMVDATRKRAIEAEVDPRSPPAPNGEEPLDEALPLEGVHVFQRRHLRNSQRSREVGQGCAPSSLQENQDPLLCRGEPRIQCAHVDFARQHRAVDGVLE